MKEHLDLGRWPEADELLDRALALPPEEREAFVRRATAHDRALGYALASIVREAERDDGFLEPGGALTGDFGAEVGRALDLQPAAHILTPGNSIEHYEVIELLGRGGMGEVYRARDRRIDREVALKVLLPQFSADPDRLARFRREAQVLAAINHPGIASIYGLAEQDTVRALVLEYVDGVTLAERLESGAMSVTEAVAIARQLAEAIEAAHEAGIIHRDLKPANIILLRGTGDRRAAAEAPALKVLDFGLGKAVAPMRGDTAMHGLTGTSPGVLLGTAAYMSPEQARAETVDERADIWAFGCVVFEMLTGTRAFPGRTAAEVLGNIIEREPAFSLLPVDTPASIRRLLRRSLEKHTSRRLSCVRDAILELDDATLPALEPAVRRPPSIAAFAAGVAALGLLAALLLQTMRRPEPVPEPVARFTVALPAGDMPAIGQQPLVALSPDGRTLVYAARRGEMTALFRRDLATLEPSLIRGTEGGTAPFFSPDGRSLGFVANGELRRIPIAGGAAQTIAAAAGDVTATWTADDGIIFSTSATRVLHRVPASGGAPAALTTLNVARGDRLHLLPQPLPGNDALLFTIVTDSERQVAVLRRKTGDTSILTTGTHARYLPSGHVIFSRDNALWAAPFDADALTLTGDPVLLLDGVQHSADQVAHLDVCGRRQHGVPARRRLRRDGAPDFVDRSQRTRDAGRARNAAVCRRRALARRFAHRARDPRTGRHGHLDRDAVAADDDAADCGAGERDDAGLVARRHSGDLSIGPHRNRYLPARRPRRRPDAASDGAAGSREWTALADPRRPCTAVRPADSDCRGHTAFDRGGHARQRPGCDGRSPRFAQRTISRVSIGGIRPARCVRRRLSAERREAMAYLARGGHPPAMGARQQRALLPRSVRLDGGCGRRQSCDGGGRSGARLGAAGAGRRGRRRLRRRAGRPAIPGHPQQALGLDRAGADRRAQLARRGAGARSNRRGERRPRDHPLHVVGHFARQTFEQPAHRVERPFERGDAIGDLEELDRPRVAAFAGIRRAPMACPRRSRRRGARRREARR